MTPYWNKEQWLVKVDRKIPRPKRVKFDVVAVVSVFELSEVQFLVPITIKKIDDQIDQSG